MKNFILRLSIFTSIVLLIMYVIIALCGGYLLLIGKGVESLLIKYNSASNSVIPGFLEMIIYGSLMAIMMFLLLRVLLIIYKSSPFSVNLIPFLNWLKMSILAYIALKIGTFVIGIIAAGKLNFGIGEEYLFVLVALIFIDIYQKSIRIHQEHQLTI